MFCIKCGSKLSEDSLFCDQCGTPIPKEFLSENDNDGNFSKHKTNTIKTNKPSATSVNCKPNSNVPESRKNTTSIIIIITIIITVGVLLCIKLSSGDIDEESSNTSVKKTIDYGINKLAQNDNNSETYENLYTEYIQKYYNEYGDETRYAMYDFDKDGIDELILSYGENSLGWTNEVFTISNEEIYSAGTFGKEVVLYKDENDEGVYAIWSKQGCGLITHITLNESSNTIETKEIESQDYEKYEANESIDINKASDYLSSH